MKRFTHGFAAISCGPAAPTTSAIAIPSPVNKPTIERP